MSLCWSFQSARTASLAAVEVEYRLLRPRSWRLVRGYATYKVARAFDGQAPLAKLRLSALLQHFTQTPAQRKRLAVGPTIDALCVETDHAQAEGLRMALTRHGVDEATFLGWRNAVCETDWANACRQLALRDVLGAWPTFLLLRLLPLVNTPPQALHALSVVQRSMVKMSLLPATRAITLLLERCLLDLNCVHLAPQLTQLVLDQSRLMLSHSSTSPSRDKFAHPVHDLLLRLVAALIRYPDARARNCAERVLTGISQVQAKSPVLQRCKTKQAIARILLNMAPPTSVRHMGNKELADRRLWRDFDGNPRVDAATQELVHLSPAAPESEVQQQKRRRHDLPWGSPPRLTKPLSFEASSLDRSSRFLTLPLATLALQHAGLEESPDPQQAAADGMRRMVRAAQQAGELDTARAYMDELVQLRSALKDKAALQEQGTEAETEIVAEPEEEAHVENVGRQREDLHLLASLGESDQAWALFNSMLDTANAYEASLFSAAQAKRQSSGAAPLSPEEEWQLRVCGRAVAPNSWDWRAIVCMVARDVDVEPMQLLRFLRLHTPKQSEQANEAEPAELRLPKALLSMPDLYADLMRCFARRPRPQLGAIGLVWSVMRRRNVWPDAETLATYCRALVEGNQTTEALQLLIQYVALEPKRASAPSPEEAPAAVVAEASAPAEATVVADNETTSEQGKVQATTQLLNVLLHALSAKGQHAAVWKMYRQTMSSENTERRIHLAPDSHTFAILLRSAADATESSDARDVPIRTAGVGRHAELGRTSAEHVLWDDMPAAHRARSVVREALLAQHPELLRCQSALQEVSAQAGWAWRGEMGMRHFEGWLQKSLHRIVGTSTAESSQGEAWEEYLHAPFSEVARTTTTRSQPILFDTVVFDEYLHLVRVSEVFAARQEEGEAASSDEIFHILAWMRALHLEPSKASLCLACHKLAEITPPSLYGVRESESAAGILHEWLEEWLGVGKVPSTEEVGEYVRKENEDWFGGLNENVITQSG